MRRPDSVTFATKPRPVETHGYTITETPSDAEVLALADEVAKTQQPPRDLSAFENYDEMDMELFWRQWLVNCEIRVTIVCTSVEGTKVSCAYVAGQHHGRATAIAQVVKRCVECDLEALRGYLGEKV